MQAAVASGEALFSSGRTAEAIALVERWVPIAQRHAGVLPQGEPVLRSEGGFALRLDGRLREATAASEHVYRMGVQRRSGQMTAVEAGSLALIWLARGRVRTAQRFARESAALLRDADSVGMLPWSLGILAQAAAQAGEAQRAREAVEAMARARLGHLGFASELAVGRAWAAAAQGELTRARSLALEAAEAAQAGGLHGFALRCHHELCRLGDPHAAAVPLVQLATRIGSPFAIAAADHAAALTGGDAGGLLDVGERFAAMDALLIAAEAADAAARVLRDEGARRAPGRRRGARRSCSSRARAPAHRP